MNDHENELPECIMKTLEYYRETTKRIRSYASMARAAEAALAESGLRGDLSAGCRGIEMTIDVKRLAEVTQLLRGLAAKGYHMTKDKPPEDSPALGKRLWKLTGEQGEIHICAYFARNGTCSFRQVGTKHIPVMPAIEIPVYELRCEEGADAEAPAEPEEVRS